MRSRLRHPSALLVALLVLVAAGTLLTATRKTPRTLERGPAIRAVLHHRSAAALLARGERWNRVRVGAVDATTTRVSFFHGPRLVAEAAVTPRGRVERFLDMRKVRVPYGVPMTYRPLFLLLAGLAFVLATAVLPLRRLRNLDVLALLGFVAPVVLLDARLLSASTLTALPSLLWLLGRCAWTGLGPARGDDGFRPPAAASGPPGNEGFRPPAAASGPPENEGFRPPAAASGPPAGDVTMPLIDALTPAWSDAQRVRILRLAVVVAALCVVLLTISAQTTVDVGQALMEGATLLVHGTLPYGHMPGDVFHGDVYPLLSYAVYAPLALFMPVRDDWDIANGALIVAAAAAVAGAWLLARLARASAARAARLDRDEADEADDAVRAAGLRAALAWLTLPPLVITVSTGTNDVLLGALLLGALVLARRPLASAATILLLGWFKVVPFALLPIWLARLRGRRLAAALVLIVASTAATLVALVALGGAGAPARMLHAVAYQVDRRTLHSPWTLLGIEWLQPLGQAAVLALVAAAVVRVRRDAALAADPVRLAAIASAVLLGLQLTGNYWTFLYLAWVVPCVVVGLLADRPRPAPALAAVQIARRPRAMEPATV